MECIDIVKEFVEIKNAPWDTKEAKDKAARALVKAIKTLLETTYDYECKIIRSEAIQPEDSLLIRSTEKDLKDIKKILHHPHIRLDEWERPFTNSSKHEGFMNLYIPTARGPMHSSLALVFGAYVSAYDTMKRAEEAAHRYGSPNISEAEEELKDLITITCEEANAPIENFYDGRTGEYRIIFEDAWDAPEVADALALLEDLGLYITKDEARTTDPNARYYVRVYKK